MAYFLFLQFSLNPKKINWNFSIFHSAESHNLSSCSCNQGIIFTIHQTKPPKLMSIILLMTHIHCETFTRNYIIFYGTNQFLEVENIMQTDWITIHKIKFYWFLFSKLIPRYTIFLKLGTNHLPWKNIRTSMKNLNGKTKKSA
jgi:hypothetical protein